jgi:hypothetical protein
MFHSVTPTSGWASSAKPLGRAVEVCFRKTSANTVDLPGQKGSVCCDSEKRITANSFGRWGSGLFFGGDLFAGMREMKQCSSWSVAMDDESQPIR